MATPDLTSRIDGILGSARQHSARSVNSAQVLANWLVGREIVNEEQQGSERAVYGENLILVLAEKLKIRGIKGFGATNLRLCRQFHLEYPQLPQGPISHTLRDHFRILLPPSEPIHHAPRDESSSALESSDLQIHHAPRDEFKPGRFTPDLSWTHDRSLLKASSLGARSFYEIESLRHAWSARELDRQINSLLFERLAKSRDKEGLLRLANQGQRPQQPADIFKDPIIIEFLGLPESEKLVESEIESALVSQLQSFLLELGQLQLYVNYYDRERSAPDDNPTLGLILCTDKNDAVVKYTLAEDQQAIFTSRYQLHLPTEEQLIAEVKRELRELS